MPALNDVTDSRPIILFDGVCNLCQRSVQFVIRNDSGGIFRFASLQSEAAMLVLEGLEYSGDRLDSVLLIVDGCLYTKSRAALQIAKRLDGLWPTFFYLFFWVPALLADWVYTFIGNRRYRWFGRKEECWIPDRDLSDRFIDL
jgi:predicted DCC family thiol-disulfide oxidoreductase YuxK